MTRLAKVAVEQWGDELRAMTLADSATALERNSTAVLANNPALTKAVISFSGALSASTTLPKRLVEMIRLRVAFHNQCRSCMAIRYQSAMDDGLTEGLVCSLEKPHEARDLSEAEKAVMAYVDLSSTDHFSIDDATFDRLRPYYTEAQIVELGVFIAFFIGFGRLSAAWDMVEDLPEPYRDKSAKIAPWENASVLVRG